MRSHPKVLFLAADAWDPNLVLRWANEGALPNVRALLDGGAWATVANSPAVFEGDVWPTFFTGASPARHGRFCYRQMRSGTYEMYDFEPEHLHCEPFWAALGRAGRRVAVIDVPKAPLVAELNGIQIADWGTHDPERHGFCTWPPHLAGEIEARIGRDPVGRCDGFFTRHEWPGALYAALRERSARKTALIGDVLARAPWDLLLAVLTETHCVGHQLWFVHDPAHPQHDRQIARTLGDPLEQIYRQTDAAIGTLLAQAGPDTTVFVYCSHGMGPMYDATPLLGTVLNRLGHAAKPVPRRRIPAPLLGLWRRLPKAVRAALAPLRDPLVRDVAASAHAFDPSGRCFQVPNNDGVAAIRVNLVGREPQGRVQPGDEFETFCAEVSDDLMQLRNADTGAPAVSRVLRLSEHFDGPCFDDLPDLAVEWSRAAPIRALISPRIGRIENPGHSWRTGDHTPDGLIVARGPGIARGALPHAVPSTNLAPTIAALLGVTLSDIDGVPEAALLPR